MPSPRRKTPRIRPVPAVERTFAILRFLARSARAQTLSEIAGTLGIIPSTGLHLLRALVTEGVVNFDPQTRRYRLGTGLVSLSRAALNSDEFVRAVQPVLERLSELHGVTALAARVQGIERMTVVALARAGSPFSLHVDIGSRFPALASATGRLVAAHSNVSLDDLKAQFETLRWPQRVEFEHWYREVERTRRLGYGVDLGVFVDGVTLVAVPYFGYADELTHTVVCADVKTRLTDTRLKDLVREMQAETAALGQLS